MKLTKVQTILATIALAVALLTSGWAGLAKVSNAMEEISSNTRHRLTEQLEEKEVRLWHLENDFPEGAAYPPGHVEKIVRLSNEIETLEVKLGYRKKE